MTKNLSGFDVMDLVSATVDLVSATVSKSPFMIEMHSSEIQTLRIREDKKRMVADPKSLNLSCYYINC